MEKSYIKLYLQPMRLSWLVYFSFTRESPQDISNTTAKPFPCVTMYEVFIATSLVSEFPLKYFLYHQTRTGLDANELFCPIESREWFPLQYVQRARKFSQFMQNTKWHLPSGNAHKSHGQSNTSQDFGM